MVVINHKGKKINIPAKKVSFFSTGLIFRTKNTKNLWFRNLPKGNFSLTSLFVFFPFLVLWLDEKNNVIDTRIAGPFKLSIKTKRIFSSIIEIPLNKRNIKIINFFVGKGNI
ncbi:hypothetical protein COU59_01585 [Candidatus Pacearchaeota archaeon CG10_big_fil_rev_8_21_14_0_10_34_12]|nr:MAG: hypothetical protein COU59_01585 [Candidatus Pacearchaeota archaeon CG10_big_fil_rev_8_21_14_0_10_34_12]